MVYVLIAFIVANMGASLLYSLAFGDFTKATYYLLVALVLMYVGDRWEGR